MKLGYLAIAAAAALPLGACSFGHPNERTAQASMSSSAGASAQPVEQRTALSPATVKQVQQELKSQGAYNGKIDGIWGPKSQAALKQYQQKQGLQATGYINPATLASLNIGQSASMGSSSGGQRDQDQNQDQNPGGGH